MDLISGCLLTLRTWPWHIYVVDKLQPTVLLTLEFEVANGQKWNRGVAGNSYSSSDRFSLLVQSHEECWLLIVALDQEGIYPVYREEDGTPAAYRFPYLNKPYRIEFDHGGALGMQYYFAIASPTKFNYQSMIRPHIENLLVNKNLSVKGAAIPYQLPLKDRFSQRLVYFDIPR